MSVCGSRDIVHPVIPWTVDRGSANAGLRNPCNEPCCSGPLKSKNPFSLSLSKRFDRLRANRSNFMRPKEQGIEHSAVQALHKSILPAQVTRGNEFRLLFRYSAVSPCNQVAAARPLMRDPSGTRTSPERRRALALSDVYPDRLQEVLPRSRSINPLSASSEPN